VITTDQEHFGLIGPLYASVARVVIAEAARTRSSAPSRRARRLNRDLTRALDDGPPARLHGVKRESGLPVLVDGAQSAGAIPVDVGELDFYTVSAQKWLWRPEPTGALYVRDPDSVRIVAPSSFSQSRTSARCLRPRGAARGRRCNDPHRVRIAHV